MSWITKLYDTYEVAHGLDISDDEKPLPVNHTYQNAHIKITLDGNGNFKRAEPLNKTQIVLPATEESAGRTSGKAPHPLADKIQYVARDYPAYGGKKESYFSSYIEQLNTWVNSGFSNQRIKSIRDYVVQGNVVSDLLKSGCLFVDSGNSLLNPTSEELDNIYGKENKPILFKSLGKDTETKRYDQGNAFVCWSVEIPGQLQSDTWGDPEIQSLWINNIQSTGAKQSTLCLVTGDISPAAESHPAKLRHSVDKAKLISSNDNAGFTFKGRFLEAVQSASVGSLASQKAHSALGWLIKRQGYRNGDQVIVAWAVSGKVIPDPMHDSFALLSGDIVETEQPPDILNKYSNINHAIDVGQSFSTALRKRLAGYQAKLPPSDNIIIMGLDSATPGRMAITYYQELVPEEFINRLNKWYQDFAWFQRRTIEYTDNKGKAKPKTAWPPGTASPRDIAEAIYGSTISDSLKKNTIERLLPCIIENRSLPRDFSDKAFHKAVNRQSYPSDQQWLWEKNLGIACSLFKGFSKRNIDNMKEYHMAIEENNCSRDYLYGRLLAIAERIEEVALNVAGEDRSTTAARLMQRFADRPASTWRNIELALQPYMHRLKSNRAGFLHNQKFLLDEVMGKFNSADFSSDKPPLSGEFLLAFHAQRLVFKNKTDLNTDSQTSK